MNKLMIVAGLVIACGAGIVKANAADDVRLMRQGLPNACRIWTAGKQNGMIFYVGCSNATPRGNTRQVFAGVVQKAFPGAKGAAPILSWQRAYPDNCSSVIETFRAMSDGLPVAPETSWPFVAVTLIDISDEDIGLPERQVMAALEGIVRRTRLRNPSRDIVMLHQADDRFVADYRAGKTPEAIRWHEAVADRYGIPTVNLAKAAARQDDWKGAQAEKDTLLCACVGEFLSQCKSQPARQEPVKHPCPKTPLMPAPWENATLVNYDRGELDLAGWLGWQLSPVDQIFHVAACSKPGPTMSIDFAGTAVGIYGVTGPDAGDLEFSVDGGPWQAVAVFDPSAKDRGYHLFHRMMVDNLKNEKHAICVRVAEAIPQGSSGRQARIGWFTVNGRDASPMGSLKPIELADTLFMRLEPLAYTSPKDRWRLIPKTMKRLREGGKVKMVMLGDSIINNIQSSQFNLLVERAYPGSKIEKIVSVRGSTGCWYYQDPEQLKAYVLKHEPDLLVIGGISQRGDVDAIRSVIRQTRAALPEVEVIVMTDIFGFRANNDPYDPKAAADPDPAGSTYRDRLLKMALEEKVEYINLTQPWAHFMKASKQPFGAFMGDAVHANARGCQLAGRILEMYFAPSGYDARAVAKAALEATSKK